MRMKDKREFHIFIFKELESLRLVLDRTQILQVWVYKALWVVNWACVEVIFSYSDFGSTFCFIDVIVPA